VGAKHADEQEWMRASASIDATAKIYGFKVDQVHTETYKMLGGLHRSEQIQKAMQAGLNNAEDIDDNLAQFLGDPAHMLGEDLNRKRIGQKSNF